MASVKRIDGKNGVSYKITVTLGTDGAGNQKRHYMTWKPDRPMKPREQEREARRIATEFETRLMEGIEADNKQTFAEYAEYVYQLRVQRGDKPQTLTYVRQMTQRINGFIGNMKLQDIRPHHLNDFYKAIAEERNLSPASVRLYHGQVHTILKQAYRDMLISYNPADRVTLPKKKSIQKSGSLQKEEIQALLKALETEPIEIQAMIYTLLVTGCRRGELLGLTWDKVDLERGEIVIDKSLIAIPGKGMQEAPTKTSNSRKVAIPPQEVEMLKRLRIWQQETRLRLGDAWENHNQLFTSWNGAPMRPNGINRAVTAFCTRHGLPPINPHKFRHTAASLLLSCGVDVVTVASMLGHSNISTTLGTYAHEIEQGRRKTAEFMDKLLSEAKENG